MTNNPGIIPKIQRTWKLRKRLYHRMLDTDAALTLGTALLVGVGAGVASGVASYKQRFSRTLKQKIDEGEIQFLDRVGATIKPDQLHQILED